MRDFVMMLLDHEMHLPSSLGRNSKYPKLMVPSLLGRGGEGNGSCFLPFTPLLSSFFGLADLV